MADDIDDGFAAHSAYAEGRRADARESLRGIEAQIVGVRADIAGLDEIDCLSDCCGSKSDRVYALSFLQAAERAVAAAHGLMRHAWRAGDGAEDDKPPGH